MIVAAAIIIVLIYLTYLNVVKGEKRPQTRLLDFIIGLLRRGEQGGFLVINFPFSRKFLQFKKYIEESGKAGVFFAFPDSEIFKKDFHRVEEFCRQKNIEYKFQDDGVLRFLVVDFENRTTEAYQFSIDLLQIVFSINPNKKMRYVLNNCIPDDIAIGNIDY